MMRLKHHAGLHYPEAVRVRFQTVPYFLLPKRCMIHTLLLWTRLSGGQRVNAPLWMRSEWLIYF